MVLIEEKTERFCIRGREPASLESGIEKLMCPPFIPGAAPFPPIESAFERAVRVGIGIDRHEFIPDICQIDSKLLFLLLLHRLYCCKN